MTEILETEILVIGGGGAASRAAIEARMAGAKVMLAVKGRYGFMGIRGGGASDGSAIGRLDYSYFSYLDGLAGRGWPGDETEAAMAFVRQSGLGTADPKLIKALIETAPKAAENLDKWGLVFKYQGSKGAARRFKPMPGLGYLVRGSGATLLEGVMMTDLLVQDGVCLGAVGLREDTGEPLVIKAGAVILASGGCAQLYLLNCHESGLTGDGHAMAYRAGAPMMNMEFMQIMPAVIHPTVALLSCTFWDMYPTIRNRHGEPLMEKYLPAGVTPKQVFDERGIHSPFSTRDKFSRYIEIAMQNEFKAGGATEQNGFPMEIEHPEKMKGESPDWLKYRGINWQADNQQCNAIFHATNGGLIIDENGQSKISGLYALGETATGPHGTDRPGGHMMGASQVFGMLAGRHAAAKTKAQRVQSPPDYLINDSLEVLKAMRSQKGDQKPSALKNRLKTAAYANLLAVKSEKSITDALNEIQSVSQDLGKKLSVQTPAELVEALEVRNLLTVGEIIARAALLRTESRGNHFREDFPQRDDQNWLGVITIQKEEQGPSLKKVVIDPEWTDRPGDMGEYPWG